MKMQWSQDAKGHWNGTHESGYNVHIHVRAPDDKYTTHKFNATTHAPEGTAANGQGSSHAHGTDDLDEAKKIGERKAGEMQRRRQSATVRQAAGELTPLDHTKGTAMATAKIPGNDPFHGAALKHMADKSPSPDAQDKQHVDAHQQAADWHRTQASNRTEMKSGSVAPQLTEAGKAHMRAAQAHDRAATAAASGDKAEYGRAARNVQDKTASAQAHDAASGGAITKEAATPKSADAHLQYSREHRAAAKSAMNPSEKGAHEAAAAAHANASVKKAVGDPGYGKAAEEAGAASKHAQWETQTRKSVTAAFVAGAQGKGNPGTNAGAKDAHQLGGLAKSLASGATHDNMHAQAEGMLSRARAFRAGQGAAEGKPHENLARQLQQGARGGSFHISKGGHKIYHSK